MTERMFPPHKTQLKIQQWAVEKLASPAVGTGVPVLYVQHGVRSGGTRAILDIVLRRVLKEPGIRVLIARRDYHDLVPSVMETFFSILPESLIKSKDMQQHKWEIDGKDGVSTVFFSGLKDVKGLGSQEFGCISVHEAHEIDEASYRTLKQRANQGSFRPLILMEGNPPTESHWLSRFTNPKDTDYDPDITKFIMPTYENWDFLPEPYKQSLESMPPAWKQRYLLGETAALPSGTPVYPSFVETVHVRETKIIPDRPIIRSMDFGLRRAACIWSQLEDSGRLLIHKEWMALETPEDQFIDGVIMRTNTWFGQRPCKDYGDPAARNRDPNGVSTLQRLQRKGISLIFRQTTYGDRIPLVNRKFSEMISGETALVIDPSCRVLIEGLSGGYHYSELKEGQEFTVKRDLPFHDEWFSHLCIAEGMRVRTLRGYIQIEKVRSGEFVWSWSYSEKRMVPAKVSVVIPKGEQLTVSLYHDGGQLIATPEHKVCLRDGSFVPIERLSPGDELMPFYEAKKTRGIKNYAWVWLNDGSEGYEHRIVYARMVGNLRSGFQVDHIDGDKTNNDPSNLQLLSPAEHCIKTRSWRNAPKGKGSRGPLPPEVAEAARKRLDMYRQSGDSHWSRQPSAWTPELKEKYRLASIASWDRKKKNRICQICGKSFWGTDLKQFCSRYCRLKNWKVMHPGYYSRESIEERKKRNSVVVTDNHKVLSVEPYGIKKVYDLVVDKTHNFVCEGIVAHNCNSLEYLLVNLYGHSSPAVSKFIEKKKRRMRAMSQNRVGVWF